MGRADSGVFMDDGTFGPSRVVAILPEVSTALTLFRAPDDGGDTERGTRAPS
jgi:hypothetical protein